MSSPFPSSLTPERTDVCKFHLHTEGVNISPRSADGHVISRHSRSLQLHSCFLAPATFNSSHGVAFLHGAAGPSPFSAAWLFHSVSRMARLYPELAWPTAVVGSQWQQNLKPSHRPAWLCSRAGPGPASSKASSKARSKTVFPRACTSLSVISQRCNQFTYMV